MRNMNTPQIFNFEQNEVRTVLVNNEPYFVGKDVASVLGYSNTKDALSRHVDLEDKMGSRITTSGQSREMTIINESGLYSLRVPTFEESVKIISTGNIILNVDGSKIDFSNTAITKKMINILKKYEIYQNTFFVISNTSQRYAFNQSYPDATLSWLLTDSSMIDNAITEVKSYQKALLSIPLNIVTDDILEKLRNTNIYYQIYNVNTKTDLNHLLIKKTPMIETDILLP